MIFFMNTHDNEENFAKLQQQDNLYIRYLEHLRVEAPPSLSQMLAIPHFFHDAYFLNFDYQADQKLLVVRVLVKYVTDDRHYRDVTLHFIDFEESWSFYPVFSDKYYFSISGGCYDSGEFHYNDFLKKYEFYFAHNLGELGLLASAKKGVYYQEYKLVFSDIKIISEEVIGYDTLKQMLKKRKQKYYSIFED